jgi:hypothetical protein
VKALLVLVFAAFGAACTPHPPYHPVAPHRGSSDGIDVEIVEVPSSKASAKLTVRAPAGTMLVRGLLVTAKAEPCREGIRDSGLGIDGQGKWLRPTAIEGSHTVMLTFPSSAAASILSDASAIDLVLSRGDSDVCVRTPFAGAAPELAWDKHPVASGAFSFRIYFPSHPVGSVGGGWSFDQAFGGIVGPMRLMGSFGVGGANCKGDCPVQDPGNGFFWIPFRFSTDAYILETRGFGIDAEAGYELIPSFRGRADHTTRTETSHGPRLALRFAATAVPQPGWPGGGRFASFGLEVFASEWMAITNSSDRSFVWGLGLVLDSGD